MNSHENTNNDLAKNIPTWSAYNSILADKKPTNTHCILPIIQGTPTDWSNLYSAIAASAKLNVNIGQSSKTIISLDLQLYEMHSVTMNWEYRPKFHFSYGGTSYCFLHYESFRKNNPRKRFRYEPFYSRYL